MHVAVQYFHKAEPKKNEWNSTDVGRSVTDDVDCQTHHLLGFHLKMGIDTC